MYTGIRTAAASFIMFVLLLASCTSGRRMDTPSSQATSGDARSVVNPYKDAIDPVGARSSRPVPATSPEPEVTLKTDKESYKNGESLLLTIENSSSIPIQFMAICSLHLCGRSGDDWICVEHECTGQVVGLEPGERLEIQEKTLSLIPAEGQETIARYKLDYQNLADESASEDPTSQEPASNEAYYFAFSNEFRVRR